MTSIPTSELASSLDVLQENSPQPALAVLRALGAVGITDEPIIERFQAVAEGCAVRSMAGTFQCIEPLDDARDAIEKVALDPDATLDSPEVSAVDSFHRSALANTELLERPKVLFEEGDARLVIDALRLYVTMISDRTEVKEIKYIIRKVTTTGIVAKLPHPLRMITAAMIEGIMVPHKLTSRFKNRSPDLTKKYQPRTLHEWQQEPLPILKVVK